MRKLILMVPVLVCLPLASSALSTPSSTVTACANCNNISRFCQDKAQVYEANCVQNGDGGGTFYDTCYCKSLRLQRTCMDEAGCASKSIALMLETPGCFQQQ